MTKDMKLSELAETIERLRGMSDDDAEMLRLMLTEARRTDPALDARCRTVSAMLDGTALRDSTDRDAVLEEAETFASIIEWGDQVFGPATVERIIERAGEEWQEMLAPGADVPTEAADVIIILLRIPGIADAIQRKMGVNRARKWSLRGDGTGYHIAKASALKSSPTNPSEGREG